jgi:hypothetical protein
VSIPKLVKSEQRLAEERMEQERIHDVLLLVTHLAKSEEVTVKLIFDRLYDVASVNLINKKIPFRPLNPIVKSIAKASEPAVRIVAWLWFQKNFPRLITNWLYVKVSFTNLNHKPQELVSIVPEVQPYSLTRVEKNGREEIQRLRSEVRYLAGISVGALVALFSTIIWVSYNPQLRVIGFPTINSTEKCVPSANVETSKRLPENKIYR